MIRFVIFIFLYLIGGVLTAQNVVQGKITEHETGSPLPGVNIFIPELSIGTVSDPTGFYEIKELPEGEFIVVFSFVGYETLNKKLFFEHENISLDIELEHAVVHGEEVVISGNFTSTQHNNTIKISTLGIQEITKTTSPSLIGSVTEIPGVNMISKGPGVVTPVIRGLSLNNIMVLNNSIPLQNYQFSENHPYMLDEMGIDRVEVIKGPASLIYGSDAIGGVINLIPEQAAAKGTVSGDFNMRYFSNTVGLLSNLGIKGNQNGVVWGIRGGMNSHKDYLQGDRQFAPNTRFNTSNIKADVGLIRKSGIFRIFYGYNKSQFGMAIEPAFQEVTENERENKVWYQNLTDHLLISQNRFFMGAVKIDIDLSYQNNNRQLMGTEQEDPFELVYMTLQTISFRAKVAHNFNKKGRYIIGIQGMLQDNENGDAPDHVLPDAMVNDLSAYALFQYNFNKVKLEAGLRYSYRFIDVPFQEAGGGHDHGDEEEEEEEQYIQYDGQFDNVSASMGFTWKANEINILRLNLASAFRSPNLAELTQQGKHGIRYEEGNPDLNVQQNIEFDIGYHLHTRHTTFDISVFYNHIFNYIHLAPTNDTTDDGDKIYRYSQADATLFGGEASLHIHPHPLDWLHFVTTFSQTVGKYDDGEYLPRIPAADLYFEIMFIKEKWKGFRDLYIKGGIDIVFAQNNPSRFENSTGNYNLVNLGVGFDVQLKRNRLSFSITASNLLDITYYDHLSTLQEVGIYDIGRNVMIGMRVPFNLKN